MNILVAVDGSDYTRRMLDYLAAHAEPWLSASNRFQVLHVVPAVPPRAAAALGHEQTQSYYKDEAEAVLGPIRAFFAGRGVQATFEHRVGNAAETIAKAAESSGYDLLVMGSHGHGSLGSLVTGSNTAKVLSACRVPLLVVR